MKDVIVYLQLKEEFTAFLEAEGSSPYSQVPAYSCYKLFYSPSYG